MGKHVEVVGTLEVSEPSQSSASPPSPNPSPTPHDNGSAPPAAEPQSTKQDGTTSAAEAHAHQLMRPHDQDAKPLVYWLTAKVTEPIRRFTAGSARVDLCRPTVRLDDADDYDRRDQRGVMGMAAGSAIGQGARMKLMRDLQLWKRPSYPDYPWLSIGMGCQYEMDESRLSLQARVKVSDYVTLKLLPQPMIKVQRALPVLDTGLVVSIRYTCPISPDAEPFERGRFMIRVDNRAGSGLHFSPAGVEVDEKVLTLGTSTRLRVAAGISMPRQIPVPEGSPMLGFKIHRLGIKTAW